VKQSRHRKKNTICPHSIVKAKNIDHIEEKCRGWSLGARKNRRERVNAM
jgi:hypothetical protein